MPRTAFVRVVEPQVHIVKENISGDPDAGYERIHVHGYDELGSPVCPVFEVPYVQEITHALHEEKIMAFNDKGEPYEKYSGRLVEVDPSVVDQFPRWIGHPNTEMSVEEIANTVLKIRVEQKKGDSILGKTRKAYRLDPLLFGTDTEGKEDYKKCLSLIMAGKIVDIPPDAKAVKKSDEE